MQWVLRHLWKTSKSPEIRNYVYDLFLHCIEPSNWNHLIKLSDTEIFVWKPIINMSLIQLIQTFIALSLSQIPLLLLSLNLVFLLTLQQQWCSFPLCSLFHRVKTVRDYLLLNAFQHTVLLQKETSGWSANFIAQGLGYESTSINKVPTNLP